VKIAFISDIHGNAVALEAVLADIQGKSVDRIAVLGDLCYRGPEPKRSLDLVRELGADVIKGNADAWTVRGVREGEVPEKVLEGMNKEREWIAAQLDEADLEFLDKLSDELILQVGEGAAGGLTIHAFHATPDSLFEVVLPHSDPESLQTKLMSSVQDASLYVYAHIHTPYIRYLHGKCVVNIGSVGLPFDGLAKASYALVEVDQENRYRVSIERVSYDVDKVVEQYRNSDYPNADFMIDVVRHGRIPRL
jgi:putative phosphoesterase